jgi:charged multivesicular body protein 4
MAELEELEQEELDEQLLEVTGPSTDNLPSVPTAEPVIPASCKF